MGELFSFSNSDFNRANKVSPEMMGASNPNQLDENGDQVQAFANPAGAYSETPGHDPLPEVADARAEPSEPLKVERQIDRRKRRRALISALVRVRGVDVTHSGPNEILTTTNASRIGILFQTSSRSYHRGMELAVTFPYCNSSVSVQAEQIGRVARVTETPDGRLAIAVGFGGGTVEDFIDASGQKLEATTARNEPNTWVELKKPLVLAVDADPAVRDMVKTYLAGEGYEVIAVASNGEAREVLKMFTPALVIAEIEGEEMPGYDLCAHVKSTENLKRIPVMLMTGSAYPSDYSSAHSLGAVVCIAKPFRQERFGHVVRLLAPLPHEKEQAARVCRADPTRRHIKGNGSANNGQKNGTADGSEVRFQIRKWK